MRTRLLVLLIIVYCTRGYSQYTLVKDYDLVRSAIAYLANTKEDFRTLAAKSHVLCFSNQEIKFRSQEIKGSVPKGVQESLLATCGKRDTSSWYFAVDSVDQVISIIYDSTFTSLLKANSTNRVNQVPLGTLSLPVFDRRRNYAIIRYGIGYTSLNAQGAVLLFRKQNGKWVFIKEFAYWIA